MPMQKVMFYTKDNQVVVADIDFTGYTPTRKKAELLRIQNYFAQYNYVDVGLNFNNRASKPDSEKQILSLMDPVNTNFVNKYVRGFDYSKDRAAFENNVGANNFPPEVKKPNTLHFDYSLPDSAVPEFIKNLGFKIVPEDVSKLADVEDPAFESFFHDQKVRMDVSSSRKKVRIFRYHYTFPPADYVRLRRLVTDYDSLSPKPDVKEYCSRIRDSHERKLFNVYASEVKFIQTKENYANHEFHHVKNRMVFQAMMCKKDVKRLTAENTYRIEVENERSAYLANTIEAINRYLKGGNFDDYSMFDNFTEDLPEKLKAMTNTQKVAYLTDMDKIVNGALKHFESSRRDYYDEHQFPDMTKTSLTSQPMDVPEDLNGEQYRQMRSAFYSLSVYNPATGKNEVRNLSKYIKPENEVQINAKQMQDIVEPAKRELEAKLQKFNTDSHQSGVDISLLDEVRAFYRRSMRTPRIIAEAQTINVADLADGKTQPDEHNPSPTPPSPPTPPAPPTPIPSDKSSWSDDLQKYWSKFDGYKEITKNNIEYGFSIKDQEVRYTSKNKVSMSSSCQYEMYDRLVKEPSGAKKAIRFEDTLSKEQALMLYVACVNNGRRMRGAIPRDLSGIDAITSIPKAELDKFKALTTPPASRTVVTPRSLTTTRAITR